jgi:hypothetical protein
MSRSLDNLFEGPDTGLVIYPGARIISRKMPAKKDRPPFNMPIDTIHIA